MLEVIVIILLLFCSMHTVFLTSSGGWVSSVVVSLVLSLLADPGLSSSSNISISYPPSAVSSFDSVVE